MTKAIIFDFDGTIVESVDTKTEAFRTLFAAYPAQLNRILAIHLQHGGLSRFEKFAMIYRDVLGRAPEPGEFDELGRRFAALVRDAVVKCPFVPGARAFLERWAARLPLVVVSGTPEEELRGIVDERQLDQFFLEVHGSPRAKSAIVADVLARHRWTPIDVLLVGDAESDRIAAETVGVRFIGRVRPGDANPFPPAVTTLPDLSSLHDRLEMASVLSPEP